jgi:hypothetical protein
LVVGPRCGRIGGLPMDGAPMWMLTPVETAIFLSLVVIGVVLLA